MPSEKISCQLVHPTYMVSDDMHTAFKAPVRPEVHPDSVEELGRKEGRVLQFEHELSP